MEVGKFLLITSSVGSLTCRQATITLPFRREGSIESI